MYFYSIWRKFAEKVRLSMHKVHFLDAIECLTLSNTFRQLDIVKKEVKLYKRKPGDRPASPHTPNIIPVFEKLADKGAVFIILLHISSQIHICVTHIVRPRARCDDDYVA